VRDVEKRLERETPAFVRQFFIKRIYCNFIKNLPSHQNQDLEKKRTLYTILIIIAALTFASTFLKICRFFRELFIFGESCCLNFVNFGVFGLIEGDYPSLTPTLSCDSKSGGALFDEAHIFFLSRIIRWLWGRRNKCK